jgi:hypothetical protein
MMRAATKRTMVARAMMTTMRVVSNEESKGSKAMATAIRVAYDKDKEGNVDGRKSDGNDSGGQATATSAVVTATSVTWAMPMATRLESDKEGKAQGWQGQG